MNSLVAWIYPYVLPQCGGHTADICCHTLTHTILMEWNELDLESEWIDESVGIHFFFHSTWVNCVWEFVCMSSGLSAVRLLSPHCTWICGSLVVESHVCKLLDVWCNHGPSNGVHCKLKTLHNLKMCSTTILNRNQKLYYDNDVVVAGGGRRKKR